MEKRNLRYGYGLLLLLVAALLFTACPDNHVTPHRNTTIHLSLQSAGTFSVLLNVSVEDSSDAWTFALSRNDSIVQTVVSNPPDTTIRDGGLLPGHDYAYKAYWLSHGEKTDSSETVYAATMDTTSHNFTWEIDTLGNYGSYLNDVAIINENDIWAVGYIVTDTATYNAAYWNGSEWEMIAIQPQGYVQAIGSIYYFSDDNIWFSSSTLPVHWNGESYYMFTPANDNYPGGSIINAIWASSTNDMYFVGSGGGIVHYDGTTFEKMESGTEVDLNDIDGTPDGEHVFVVGYEYLGMNAGESIALQMTEGNWITLYKGINLFSEPYGLIKSVTIINETAFIGCTEGVWQYNYLNNTENILSHDDLNGITSIHQIRANASNDIFIVSNWGMISHYNGYSWQLSSNLATIVPNDGSFFTRGLGNTANMVIIAGLISGELKAMLITGIRY